MRSIAVINQKGGSGKTTTAVNLAAGLALLERRVLLLDLDAQASATLWYSLEDESRGLLDVLTGDGVLADLVRPTSTAGVDMVPATSWLMLAERLLASHPGAETRLRQKLGEVSQPSAVAVSSVSPLSAFDYLIVDCPPTLGILTVNALAAVREVLIPVETHVLPLHGLRQLRETVDLVQERLNPELAVTGILACRFRGRTRLARQILDDLRSRFGDLVFQTTIRENVRLAECPSFGRPIFEHAGRSHGAEDYRALAAEVLGQESSSSKLEPVEIDALAEINSLAETESVVEMDSVGAKS